MTSGFRHIIFDLDGTLVDSAPHCAALVTEMLAARGSQRIVAAVEARKHLTRSGSQLVGALLGSEGGDTFFEVADFRRRYVARDTPADCPFPGVGEGLAHLTRAGLKMAICSNKPQQLCEKIVSDLGWDNHFSVIVGSVSDIPLKPEPDLARQAMERLDVAAADCLFVGDSEVDWQTAVRAGTPFALMTYGYAEAGSSIDAMARFDDFGGLVAFVSDGGESLTAGRGVV